MLCVSAAFAVVWYPFHCPSVTLVYCIHMAQDGSGTLLPFMAKWTLSILDGGGWGVGGVTTGLYSCRMLRSTQWITSAQRSEQKSNYSRYPKSRAFILFFFLMTIDSCGMNFVSLVRT